jgi:hypothetical protein
MKNKKKRKEKAKRFDAGTARIHCYIGLPIKSLANAVAMLFNRLDRKRMKEIDRENDEGKTRALTDAARGTVNFGRIHRTNSNGFQELFLVFQFVSEK